MPDNPMGEDTTTIHHDGEEHHTATTAVLDAVSDALAVDPRDLPALYDAIDPDALDAVIRHDAQVADSDARVEFSYDGFRVVVRSGPRVTVRPLEEP